MGVRGLRLPTDSKPAVRRRLAPRLVAVLGVVLGGAEACAPGAAIQAWPFAPARWGSRERHRLAAVQGSLPARLALRIWRHARRSLRGVWPDIGGRALPF